MFSIMKADGLQPQEDIMALAKATIPCARCGGGFTFTLTTFENSTSSDTYRPQHNGPGGCGKNTSVHYNNGQVDRTSK